MALQRSAVIICCALLLVLPIAYGQSKDWRKLSISRKLLQGTGFQWCQIDPFCIQPPSPPPVFFPPPPPPPPFTLFPVANINATEVINGFLQIPGALGRLTWDQATLYFPVTAEILKGSQPGANQILIDGEDRKSQDINQVLNAATNIAMPFSAYTAWLAPAFTLGGLLPLGGPPGAQVPGAAPAVDAQSPISP
eukprot:jgi/Botrbrau1/8738/Bobra.0090s0013.1